MNNVEDCKAFLEREVGLSYEGIENFLISFPFVAKRDLLELKLKKTLFDKVGISEKIFSSTNGLYSYTQSRIFMADFDTLFYKYMFLKDFSVETGTDVERTFVELLGMNHNQFLNRMANKVIPQGDMSNVQYSSFVRNELAKRYPAPQSIEELTKVLNNEVDISSVDLTQKEDVAEPVEEEKKINSEHTLNLKGIAEQITEIHNDESPKKSVKNKSKAERAYEESIKEKIALLDMYGISDDGSDLFKVLLQQKIDFIYAKLEMASESGISNPKEIKEILALSWGDFTRNFSTILTGEPHRFYTKAMKEQSINAVKNALVNKYVFDKSVLERKKASKEEIVLPSENSEELDKNKKSFLDSIINANDLAFSVTPNSGSGAMSDFILPKNNGVDRVEVGAERPTKAQSYSEEEYIKGLYLYRNMIEAALESAGADIISTPFSNGGSSSLVRTERYITSKLDPETHKVVPVEYKKHVSLLNLQYFVIRVGNYAIIEPMHNSGYEYANATFVLPLDRYYEFVETYQLGRNEMKEGFIKQLYKIEEEELRPEDQITTLYHIGSVVISKDEDGKSGGGDTVGLKKDKKFNPFTNSVRMAFLLKTLSEQDGFISKKDIKKSVSKENIEKHYDELKSFIGDGLALLHDKQHDKVEQSVADDSYDEV